MNKYNGKSAQDLIQILLDLPKAKVQPSINANITTILEVYGCLRNFHSDELFLFDTSVIDILLFKLPEKLQKEFENGIYDAKMNDKSSLLRSLPQIHLLEIITTKNNPYYYDELLIPEDLNDFRTTFIDFLIKDKYLNDIIEKRKIKHKEALKLKCPCCNETNHPRSDGAITLCLLYCDKFIKLKLKEKLKFVKANHICELCLKQGHSTSMCFYDIKCTKCENKHHKILCNNNL